MRRAEEIWWGFVFIILAIAFYVGLAVLLLNVGYHDNSREHHSIVGAPWDWYDDQQENPQSHTRGWGNERIRIYYRPSRTELW